MALTFGDFLSIFTTNDASGGRAIKATFDTGIDDVQNYLTKNDPAGGRAIKITISGGVTKFWTEAQGGTQTTSSWTATGAATDINAAIIPKGNGAFVADIPDGTATGGNARGTNAVDLQMSRSAATQVAGGANSFIGSGTLNTIISGSTASAIVSGNNNQMGSYYSFIGGGSGNQSNTANNSAWHVICGGNNNRTNGGAGHNYVSILGGDGNNASGTHSTIGGGSANATTVFNAAIFAGSSNTASGAGAFIGGGSSSTASGERSAIGGGWINTASGAFGTVSGGWTNRALGAYATVGGGQSNTASGANWATVGGGYGNSAGANGNVVAGGYQNNCGGNGYSAIVGGEGNSLSSQFYGFIGAGQSNGNGANYAVIVGGRNNSISSGSPDAAIGGGQSNTIFNSQWTVIGGGQSNSSNPGAGQSNQHNVIAGGLNNISNSNLQSYTKIPGGAYANASLYGQFAHASGQFSAAGDAQAHELIWRRAITGTAQTELFLDGTSVAAILPGTNSVWNGIIDITSICTVVGDGTTVVGHVAATAYKVTIKRIGTTTSLVGGVQEIGITNADASMATVVFTIDNNDTNESLRVRFTPPSTAGSTTVIRAVATFRGTQIQY